MKVALVGIGAIARNEHVPAIADSPDWELAATVSRSGTVEGVPAYTDLGDMLAAHPDIRVVSLCMPPAPRYAYAEQALAAGRHVMLEKPPGATLSECLALEGMARAARVALYGTWHSRQAAQVAAAKDWLVGKSLKRLTVTWKEDVRHWHPGQEWIWEPGGLGVFDPGINALSIVTEIVRAPMHITQAVLSIPENRQTPIAASMQFHHPEGAEVTMTFDWRQEGGELWTIEAETDAGTLVLMDGGGRMAIDGVAVTGSKDVALAGEYSRLYADMARLVKEGAIDLDLAPFRHVADAFMLGRRETVAPFES
jgi:D-galactose 1-dehydrogenase